MARVSPGTGVACAALAAALLGCAGAPAETLIYKLYPGPVRPANEIAIVRLGDAATLEIDGRPVSHADWTEVHVLPGTHRLRWQTEFGVSALIDPSMTVTGGREAEVTLDAGRAYVLRADRTTGPGYRMFFWVEEAGSGRVVVGRAKP